MTADRRASTLTPLDLGVCAPRGFRAAGVAAGIKSSGSLDLALILSDASAAAAGLFTTNRVAAAPVQLSRARVASGAARAVVVNAGCANACTGRRGLVDAEAMAEEAAARLGIAPAEVLVCSTGHIGSYLPMEAVRRGIAVAASRLSADDREAARAIMTTDTRSKRASVAHSDGWWVGGVAKGAGMIAPEMATMLAFLTTDARVEASPLRVALSAAAEGTFDAISVDGDTSTNDTVLAFANGLSDVSPDPEELAGALEAVCSSLAEQIVADGEGATKLVRVRVGGAAGYEQARRAARTVADSLLVKCAVYGCDANWGRVAAALGRAGVAADFERLSISMGGVVLLDRGVPASAERLAGARAAMQDPDVTIHCDLGTGDGAAEVTTTDLSPEYVRINSRYELPAGGQAPTAMSVSEKGRTAQALAKARVLTEALPYIQRWAGSTVVVKVGGEALESDEGLDCFATDIVLLKFVGINPVVVHGGGPQISAAMRERGRPPRFVEGRRVSDAETIEIVKAVLLGQVNRRLVSSVNEHGARAAGISGEDEGLLLARRVHGPGGEDLGFVGEVERVDASLLNRLIDEDCVPVVAPLGAGPDGVHNITCNVTYNINADMAAGALAAAVGAQKIVFLTNVPGLYRDLGDEGSLISETTAGQLEQLLAEGTLSEGMIPKIASMVQALRAGVPQAHILDGRVDHALLLEVFTDEGAGTMVLP